MFVRIDKRTNVAFYSAHLLLIKYYVKFFRFLLISSAISTTQKVACSGEGTVRHVRSASPTSVIQKKATCGRRC